MSRKQRQKKGELKSDPKPIDTKSRLRGGLKWWVAPLVLLLLVLTVYGNSLNNQFVSDDVTAILQNPTIGTWQQTNPAGPTLGLVNFVIVNLFGKNPFWFRLVNIMFHWGSAVWLYKLMAVATTGGLALTIAMIFAVHPLATEAVTWVSGMPYTIYVFYYFLSLFLFVRNGNTKEKVIGFSVFALGVLSNALAVVFPIVLAFWLIVNRQFRLRFKEWLIYAIATSVELARLLGLAGTRLSTLQSNYYQDQTRLNPIIQIPVAIASYLKLIFWPQELTLYHSEMSFDFWSYSLMLGVVIGLLILIIWMIKKIPLVAFWLGFFLISLFPTLTPSGISWIVAERYAYFGFVGVVTATILLIDRFWTNKTGQRPKVVVLSLVLVLLGGRTMLRNLDWKDQDSLWLATAKYSPTSPQNHNNLGDLYSRRGDFERAIEEFGIAIKLNPRYADAYHNLANVYLQKGDFGSAEANYKKALEFNPNLWQSYQQMAAILFQKKDLVGTEQMIIKAISINRSSELLRVLGIVYLNEGRVNEAKEAFREALKLDPKNVLARQGLDATY